jgi:hypothetical protein
MASPVVNGMRSSELFEILDSTEEVGALRQAIAPAVASFRAGLSVRGGSAPIDIKTEGREFRITEVHVRKLCEEYLAERLDEVELSYVATALELSPDFVMASEGVEEAISLLSDPAANSPMSREVAEALLRSL